MLTTHTCECKYVASVSEMGVTLCVLCTVSRSMYIERLSHVSHIPALLTQEFIRATLQKERILVN